MVIHRHLNAVLTEPPGKIIEAEQTDLLIIPKDHSPVFIHHQECTAVVDPEWVAATVVVTVAAAA